MGGGASATRRADGPSKASTASTIPAPAVDGAAWSPPRPSHALPSPPPAEAPLVPLRECADVGAESKPPPPSSQFPPNASTSGVSRAVSVDDRSETLAALEGARSLALRRLTPGLMRRLIESSSVEEYPPASTVQCLHLGSSIVLSGQAVIEASFPAGAGSPVSRSLAQRGSPRRMMIVELAQLRRGDSINWQDYRPQENPASPSSKSKVEPRLRVGGAETLRLCRFNEDLHDVLTRCQSVGQVTQARRLYNEPSKLHPGVQVASAAAERELGSLGEGLAALWLCASPPFVGIGEQRSALRAHFLASLWAPLQNELEEHKTEIQNRHSQGFRKHDCFPLQGHQIVGLRNHVRHLSEIWYGEQRGCNSSIFYRWFMEAMGVLGVTAYAYESIPKELSPDGWCCVVDGAARAESLKGKGNTDAHYIASGGMAQRQGRSAIDNTVLRNVMMPKEAREMLIGRRLRKVACKFFALRQVQILNKVSEHLQLDLKVLASKDSSRRDRAAASAVLKMISADELLAMGIDKDSICWRQLILRGTVLAGFGQLTAEDQKAVWEAVRRLVNPPDNDDDALRVDKSASNMSIGPGMDSEDVFEQFVAWSHSKPGEFFQGSKARHIQVCIAGVWANRIVIVRRSAMERFSLARYFPLYWRRTQPLWGMNAEPFQVREQGVTESSHVRVNECPYAGAHGMALSGGSHADEAAILEATVLCGPGVAAAASAELGPSLRRRRQSFGLLTELQWIKDPAANIENWFLTDIEKIVQEAWQLNPHGPKEIQLPGEMFVVVGQNPKVGSSIKETQHTQLYEGSLSTYPVLQIEGDSRFSARLQAWIDIVAVGPIGDMQEEGETNAEEAEILAVGEGDDLLGDKDQRGIFLKVRTESPTAPELMRFLVEFRLALLKSFGGGTSIDFLVLAMSDECGGFVIILAPIPQLMKLGDEHPDLAAWANPLTGESSDVAGLQEARVDVGKGVGHFLVAKPALREQLLGNGEDTLRRIWAFNRVPGMRQAIDTFLQEWRVFEPPGSF